MFLFKRKNAHKLGNLQFLNFSPLRTELFDFIRVSQSFSEAAPGVGPTHKSQGADASRRGCLKEGLLASGCTETQNMSVCPQVKSMC